MSRTLGGAVDAVTEILLAQGGVWALLLGLVLSAGWGAWKEVRARRAGRKVLSYNVLFNSRLGLDPPDAGELVRLHDRQDEVIADPSMVVVRITNEGRTDISADDYQLPVELEFGRRSVKTVDVTEAHPPDLVRVIAPRLTATVNRVVLPPEHLNAASRFKLLVLLSGHSDENVVRVGGVLKGGEIVDARRQQQRNVRNWRVATTVTASLCAGALIVVWLVNSAGLRPTPPGAPRCVEGTLDVGGSSAFGTAASRVIGSYTAYCEDATIRLSVSNSQHGLEQLRDLPNGDQSRVALSDGPADPNVFPGLVERAVAIVPFSVVVHPSVTGPGVDSLTLSTTQLRRIFDGRQKTWRDVDPRLSPVPVRIVGRGQSGSRVAFERYVLGDGRTPRSQGERTSSDCVNRTYASEATILCEESTTAGLLRRVTEVEGAIGYADAPDAQQAQPAVVPVRLDGRDTTPADIGAGYPFWTVEYVYRRQQSTGVASLASSVVDYLTGDAQANVLTATGYPACAHHAEICARR
ncbi:substrate-binding domain-containing protein [Plantactinospora sp. B24E8]|uniref:PstS family phosphate ABC transporter substrate-binding protein n=1 Tax=Plantactinospora sp. B24E8 TaxID=3153567 RepID=UPI00325C5155